MNGRKLRRLIIPVAFILLTITLFTGKQFTPLAIAGAADLPHVEGQIIVQLNPASGATIEEINTTYNTTTIQLLAPSLGIYLLQAPTGTPESDIIEAMEFDLRLIYAEFNFIGELPEAAQSRIWAWGGPDDAPYFQQYAADLLNLNPAHAITKGEGTIIAILDTGIQLDHPALAAFITDTGFDFIDNDTIPADVYDGLNNQLVPGSAGGHGTHVAGIVHLVAPEAQLMPVRVLGPDGSGNAFTVAEAVLYAIDHGADVINLSMGMPKKSETLVAVIREATLNGVVVVAAAGNEGTRDKQFPAAGSCALAVTAVGPNMLKADFASFGSWVDFAAPGDGIYSTFPVNGYATWSGTSMATPFVSGQAALLRSLGPTLTARDIALLMSNTARSLKNINPPGIKLGAGLPNIAASIDLLLTGPIPTTNRSIMSGSCVEPGPAK